MSSPPRYPHFLAPLLLALSFFLLSPTLAHAQMSEPISLPTIIGYVKTLEQRLELREKQAKAQVIYWQNIVAALKQENENDNTCSIELLAKLEAAQAELSKSQTAYAATVNLLALSDQAFSDYKTTSERQIKGLELQLRLYKSASIIVSVSLAATGIYILGDRLEWW